MLTLQSRAIDQCTKAVKADRAGEGRRALYYYKQSLTHLMEWLTLEKKPEVRLSQWVWVGRWVDASVV